MLLPSMLFFCISSIFSIFFFLLIVPLFSSRQKGRKEKKRKTEDWPGGTGRVASLLFIAQKQDDKGKG